MRPKFLVIISDVLFILIINKVKIKYILSIFIVKKEIMMHLYMQSHFFFLNKTTLFTIKG